MQRHMHLSSKLDSRKPQNQYQGGPNVPIFDSLLEQKLIVKVCSLQSRLHGVP